MFSYLIISAVKDEEQYIETTLESVLLQTVRPARWIIVDDGSGDRTAEIVERYSRNQDWISLIRLPRRDARLTGTAEIIAFNAGLTRAQGQAYDFVVKLDCDLLLPSGYFEQILGRFKQDPRLGIASGVYIEERNGVSKAVPMPEYHAAGASKVIRRRCFEEIGGFVTSRGWDTVDEIRAQTLGWRTRHFADITFDHLRPEGSSLGPLYTNYLHGEVYYLTGGSWSFFLFKTLHRIVVGKPPLIGGLTLLGGFLKPWVMRRDRLVNSAECKWYRQAQQQRVWRRIKEASSRFGLRLIGERQD
jgi:biofilm PGA synthesis N-glycosyltransferase PgaC